MSIASSLTAFHLVRFSESAVQDRLPKYIPNETRSLRISTQRARHTRSPQEVLASMGGRAFGPPLCRGCAPATPPYKTIPHRPCAFFATCRLASMAAAVHRLRHQVPGWFQGRLSGQVLWLSSYEVNKKRDCLLLRNSLRASAAPVSLKCIAFGTSNSRNWYIV